MSRRTVVKTKNANLYSYMKLALDRARSTGIWMVLVCPSDESFLADARSVLAGLLPSGSKFGGRTAIFPGGGRLTVISAASPVFIPEGTDFTTLFIGWDKDSDKKDHQGMMVWRDRSAQTLDLMTKTGGANA